MAKNLDSATAFAPATVANVGPGYDLLGFPIESLGDTITVRAAEDMQVKVINNNEIPIAPEQNVATVALESMRKELNLKHAFAVEIDKGIPISSGLGGSAASAVGAVVAANALCFSSNIAAAALQTEFC